MHPCWSRLVSYRYGYEVRIGRVRSLVFQPNRGVRRRVVPVRGRRRVVDASGNVQDVARGERRVGPVCHPVDAFRVAQLCFGDRVPGFEHADFPVLAAVEVQNKDVVAIEVAVERHGARAAVVDVDAGPDRVGGIRSNSSSSSSRSRRSIGCIAIQCDQSMVFVHRRLYRFAKGHQDVVLRHRNDRRTPFVGNVVTEIVVAGFVLVEIGHAAALSQGHVVGGIKEDPHVYFGSSGIGGTRAIITNNARKIEVPYVVSTGGPSNVHDVLAKVVGKKIVAFFTASKQASQNVIVIVVVVIIAVVIAVLGCCFCCRFWRDGFFPMIRRR